MDLSLAVRALSANYLFTIKGCPPLFASFPLTMHPLFVRKKGGKNDLFRERPKMGYQHGSSRIRPEKKARFQGDQGVIVQGVNKTIKDPMQAIIKPMGRDNLRQATAAVRHNLSVLRSNTALNGLAHGLHIRDPRLIE